VAQSVPVVLKGTWVPNPVGDNATQYTLTLDGGTPQIILAATCTATACSGSFPVPTFGNHTVVLIAQNVLLAGATTGATLQSSPPSTLTFTLNPAPGAVTGGKIGQ
jgi:hypothetical protein